MTSLWLFKKLFTWSFSSIMNVMTSHFHQIYLVTGTNSICQPPSFSFSSPPSHPTWHIWISSPLKNSFPLFAKPGKCLMMRLEWNEVKYSLPDTWHQDILALQPSILYLHQVHFMRSRKFRRWLSSQNHHLSIFSCK